MKNYSSNRAQKGKTAYRTPSLFKANKAMYYAKMKGKINDSYKSQIPNNQSNLSSRASRSDEGSIPTI